VDQKLNIDHVTTVRLNCSSYFIETGVQFMEKSSMDEISVGKNYRE